jgi:hypothetical protein
MSAEEGEEPPGMRRMRERVRRLKHPRLRILVESYQDTQKLRIASFNRLNMYSKLGLLTSLQEAKLGEMVSDLKAEERKLQGMMEQELEEIPVWQWLRTIKGMGPAMAAGLIAWIDDIGKAPHVSSLWRYAGLHVEDGRAPRRKRGEKADWNPRLRTHMWKITKQILMAKDPFYYGWYKEFKEREVEKCKKNGIRIVPASKLPTKGGKKYEPPGVISQGHVENRARRKVAKLLLAHLWHVWREMEGLPTEPAYPAKLGHRIIPPPNWPLPVIHLPGGSKEEAKKRGRGRRAKKEEVNK